MIFKKVCLFCVLNKELHLKHALSFNITGKCDCCGTDTYLTVIRFEEDKKDSGE